MNTHGGDWPSAPAPVVDGDAALLAGLLDAQNHEEDNDEDEQTVPGPANTRESGIGGTSAVGIFPDGRADCGAEDMAGNVWEWCATAYPDYPLPDDLGPETLDTQALIVLRGGSWDWRSITRSLRGALPPRPCRSPRLLRVSGRPFVLLRLVSL